MSEFQNTEICCPAEDIDEEFWVAKLEAENIKIENFIADREVIMKTVSQSIRYSIIHHLADRPHCVCELVKKFKIGNSTVSYHLNLLVENGIISGFKQGGMTFYQLTKYGLKVVNWMKGLPLMEGENG